MRESKTRGYVNLPEKDNHTSADRRVEMTFRLGDQLYAIEHTAIEPFELFIEHQNRAPQLFAPLESAATTALASVIQPGIVIEMHLPLGELLRRKMYEVRSIHSALVSWAVSKAPNLKAGKYADYRRGPHIITEQPDGVPFPVSLMLFGVPNVPGHFQLKHLVSGAEQERALRLQRACEDKFPKLAIWKQLHNARSILVLEENDVQLTNVVIVADAFLSIARKRHDVPDETYMVSTHAPPWRAWSLLVNGRDYFDLAADRCVDFEIDLRTP